MSHGPDGHDKKTCPYCGETVEGFDALKAHVIKSHHDVKVPEPEGMIRMTINGSRYALLVEPEWTLHEVIHDRLGLIGAKTFCDRGACGSCTVIMDGRSILSCMTLAIECDDATIETAEGIAASGHPLIESYVKHHCMQCGYCTPGFVTTAKALLDKNPSPTEAEIREALGGNLCRCGTYPQHPKAIMEAAEKLTHAREGHKHDR
jgi:aerobic-type carbon monoxide dehydrogenase small subunit (CoxS/CutS family)